MGARLVELILFTCLLGAQAAGAAEVAKTAPTPGTSAYPEQCRKFKQDKDCANLSEDANYQRNLLRCDDSDSAASMGAMLASCGSQALGAWGEILNLNPHNLVTGASGAISEHLKTQAKPQMARQNFLNSCRQSSECLTHLFKAAHRRLPTDEDLRQIQQSWFANKKMHDLYDQACGPGLGCASQDPWFNGKLAEIYGSKSRAAPEALVERVQGLIGRENNKFWCQNKVGRTEMACYYAATVVDPLMAAAALKKLPHLKNLIEVTPLRAAVPVTKAVGPPADMVQAEKIFGRPLTAAEKDAVERAHQVGYGEKGLDESPAGLGNYTKEQRDEKRRIMTEAKIPQGIQDKLMQAGVVGLDNIHDLAKPAWHKLAEVRVTSSVSKKEGDELAQRLLGNCRHNKPVNDKCREVIRKLDDLHTQQTAEAKATASKLAEEIDKAPDDKIEQLLPHLEAINRCKRVLAMIECHNAFEEVKRILGGPAKPSKPVAVASPSKPREVPLGTRVYQQLDFLPPSVRGSLQGAFTRALQSGQAASREMRRQILGRGEYQFFNGRLDQAIKSLLDHHVGLDKISAATVRVVDTIESKAMLEFTDRHTGELRRVVFDAVKPYFTVKSKDATGKFTQYHHYMIDREGRMRPHPTSRAHFTSHFAYGEIVE